MTCTTVLWKNIEKTRWQLFSSKDPSFRGEYSQLSIHQLCTFLGYSNHKQFFLFKAFCFHNFSPTLEKSWLRPCLAHSILRRSHFFALTCSSCARRAATSLPFFLRRRASRSLEQSIARIVCIGTQLWTRDQNIATPCLASPPFVEALHVEVMVQRKLPTAFHQWGYFNLSSTQLSSPSWSDQVPTYVVVMALHKMLQWDPYTGITMVPSGLPLYFNGLHSQALNRFPVGAPTFCYPYAYCRHILPVGSSQQSFLKIFNCFTDNSTV